MFSKLLFFVLIIVATTAHSHKPRQNKIQLRNISRHRYLRVQISGLPDITISHKKSKSVELANGWSGTITTTPYDCDECDRAPKTKVEMALNEDEDSYSVSLVDGFNMGITVVPIKGKYCSSAAVCKVDLNKMTTSDNHIKNSKGEVIACQNTPELFRKICPKAMVSSDDTDKIVRCKPKGYLILFG